MILALFLLIGTSAELPLDRITAPRPVITLAFQHRARRARK